MVNSTDLVLKVIDEFERLCIPYMLVGSYSSNYYGRPRSTHDADFVVEISDEQISKLRTGLSPELQMDTQMSFETVTMHMRYVIVHPKSAFKIEVFLLADDVYHQERFRRRRQVEFEGRLAWLPTPEDVVVQKVYWGQTARRAKDIEDVQQVLSVQRGKLDLVYIRHWCDQQGTREFFEKLLEAAELRH
jgi:hypothetical protein